jgi:hypothetical protein
VLVVAILLSGIPAGFAATLDVRPDARVVDENATLRLTIRLDDNSPDETPDFSALDEDFEILGQQTASQFRSINGRVESWTDWVLTLRPKRTGRLTIPAITLGQLRSEEIPIEVRPLDPATRAELDRLVRFEVTVEPDPVYVQAQLLVTRRLVYAEGTQLYGELPANPTITGAVVQSLGEAQHSSELRDGHRYGVIAQRFAVFPEQSGTVTLPSVTILASVTMPRRDRSGYMRMESRVASDPVEVKVMAVPAAYPKNAPWLPAERVEIVEDWQSKGDWAVGEPRTRTLIVRADGAAASRIAPLDNHYPDTFKLYADPPDIHEQATATGIVGTRTETVRLVPMTAGKVEFAAIEIPWWNTRTGTVEFARLAPRTEQTFGESIIAPTREPTAAAARPTRPTPPADLSAAPPWLDDWPWLLAGLAVVALLLTGVAIRRRVMPAGTRSANERAAFADLKRACKTDAPNAIRAALDVWLEARHGDIAGGMRAFTTTTQASNAVNALNARLYGGASADALVGGELLAAVQAHRTSKPVRPNILPPLYPDATA